MSIEIKRLSKSFGNGPVLRDVNLRIRSGELMALLGPSGSGKTTLLRIVAGLEEPDPGSGPIFFDDQDVSRMGAADRHVGFLFQHYGLFRHMTVFDNIAFGLRVRPRKLRPSEDEIEERVQNWLRLVQLESLADRYPHELSGGQRQRIALVRALAIEPSVLLLDEPFGALDAKVRRELRHWLCQLHRDLRLTSIFVTHDQEEAREIADCVTVIDRGRIEQAGTFEEVLLRPATSFVKEFLSSERHKARGIISPLHYF